MEVQKYLPVVRLPGTGMGSGAKAVIIGGAVAGVVGIGAYLAYSTIQQSNCSNPASACYQSLAAYKQEFQSCWALYIKYLQQFTTEDAKLGIAISASQQSILNQYLDCANQAAGNIAKTASNYKVTNPIQYTLSALLPYIGAAIVLYVGVRSFKYILSRGYRFGNTPGTWAQAARGGTIDYNVASGNIPASGADAMRTTVTDGDTVSSELRAAYLNAMQEASVIDVAEADTILATDESIQTADDALVEEELATGFE